MTDVFRTNVNSEIGKLEGVVLHTPGKEIENMTPRNAEKALYSDILNRSVACKEYSQLRGVLGKVTKTFQVKTLLAESIEDPKVKEKLVHRICKNESVLDLKDHLLDLKNEDLAKALLEGVKLRADNLTKFFSEERYELKPLHNFFFTRDASMAVKNKVLIGRMANVVREREALIMEQIFNCHKLVETEVVNPLDSIHFNESVMIEGGDFLVAREDVLCIGNGTRTSTQGIDFIINFLKERKIDKHIIVQELPAKPESFIHLDMVFTFLDKDKCMAYEPLILKPSRYRTVHISVKNGEVEYIRHEDGILATLKKLGIDLKPLICGGRKDPWIQEREQWHSGANFFCLGPGKVIGYGRNVHTIEELNKNGFEIISARDVIEENVNLADYENSNYAVIIDGSELARGGGGCRCMTMPVRRAEVIW